MSNHLKSESESFQRSDEMSRCVDEKDGLFDLLFLAEFAQEQHGQMRRSRLIRPCVKDLVHLGIDGGVQPVSLVVDLNHRFVDRALIRADVTVEL
jgi:hypothetical protein